MRTCFRQCVDIEPRFLHEEAVDLQAALARSEMKHGIPFRVLGSPQVYLLRDF
jgi:hypothetical protein